jgi:signal peptidase I
MRIHRLLLVILAVLGLAVIGLRAIQLDGSSMQVVGWSMAPGLSDGDRILAQRLAGPPGRLSRVVCRLSHGDVVKRLVGYGGERITCSQGELTVDGRLLQKTPQQLAELGTILADTFANPAGERQPDNAVWRQDDDGWEWSARESGATDWLACSGPDGVCGVRGVSPALRFDDAPWLPAESRRLETVRDRGIAAIIEITVPVDAAVEIRLRHPVGMASTRVRGAGRLAVVAGQLDGRLVAAAWPIHPDPTRSETRDRLCSPPRRWSLGGIASGWPAVWPAARDQGDRPEMDVMVAGSGYAIGLRLTATRGTVEGRSCHARVRRVALWRDVHWLPVPGNEVCEIPAGHVFLLGDCPSASRDSRHWGAVPEAAVLGKVVHSNADEY